MLFSLNVIMLFGVCQNVIMQGWFFIKIFWCRYGYQFNWCIRLHSELSLLSIFFMKGLMICWLSDGFVEVLWKFHKIECKTTCEIVFCKRQFNMEHDFTSNEGIFCSTFHHLEGKGLCSRKEKWPGLCSQVAYISFKT